MEPDRLTSRQLNRTTLDRQLLLERRDCTPLATIDHLVGMQAQIPLDPYTGLWSRLVAFQPLDVAELLLQRKVVRVVVMRGTIHLVTADDCLLLRPLTQPVLDGEISRHSQYAPPLQGVEMGPVLEFARTILGERPHTGPQLRTAMKARFPDVDPAALAYACRCYLALVQLPPRGVWGQSAQVTSMTAEGWLGRPLVANPSIDDVVLRYLRAFGPASVADVAAWSRLSGMREVIERLRPRLRTYQGPKRPELFDLADIDLVDPETPAPPRLLPQYDNLLLSHADRARFVSPDDDTNAFAGTTPVQGTVLVDGLVFGPWNIERDPTARTATLVIHHARSIDAPTQSALTDEATAYLRFAAADAAGFDVRLIRVG